MVFFILPVVVWWGSKNQVRHEHTNLFILCINSKKVAMYMYEVEVRTLILYFAGKGTNPTQSKAYGTSLHFILPLRHN